MYTNMGKPLRNLVAKTKQSIYIYIALSQNFPISLDHGIHTLPPSLMMSLNNS